MPVSPFVGTHQPTIPDDPPPVLTTDELRRLLATCSGRDHTSFFDRRDYAIILVFLDCGLRHAEIAGIGLEDVDWTPTPPLLKVTGKGNRVRHVPMGVDCALAVRRYLRDRKASPYTKDHTALWIGKAGALTYWGIKDVIDQRREQAGIKRLYPHLLRHTWAHLCLANGAAEGQLMPLGGWLDPTMVRYYGRSMAQARAQKAHASFSPVDHLDKPGKARP